MKFWASSTAPDTDFTAQLVDVYPPSKDFPAGFRPRFSGRDHSSTLSQFTEQAEP